MSSDSSFILLPNRVNVNSINDDVPNQINTEVNYSLNVVEDESSSIESMEHPIGSGNWWDWNAVKGNWELLENHVSEDDISITSDILLEGNKEYPIDSGIWWSWDSENYAWQKIEQSLGLVEQDTNNKNVDITLNEVQSEAKEITDVMSIDDLIDDPENLIRQGNTVNLAVQESNHICWACVKPLGNVGWSFCPTCGARYHSSKLNECNSQDLFNCINCAQSTSGFIRI